MTEPKRKKKHKRAWDIDREALSRACKAIGLKHSVKIRITAQKRTSGQYLGLCFQRRTAGKRAHEISISTYLSTKDAGKTLWHELTHALQRERYRSGALFCEAYEASLSESLSTSRRETRKPDGYDESPFEQEAAGAESRNKNNPLCRDR
jgi:hypothetical protein